MSSNGRLKISELPEHSAEGLGDEDAIPVQVGEQTKAITPPVLLEGLHRRHFLGGAPQPNRVLGTDAQSNPTSYAPQSAVTSAENVTVVPPGSSSVATTVAKVLSSRAMITNAGAKPDNSNPSLTRLLAQRVLDDNPGAEIHFPGGILLVDEPLRPSMAGQLWRGDGMQRTEIRTTHPMGEAIRITGPGQLSGFAVRDMKLCSTAVSGGGDGAALVVVDSGPPRAVVTDLLFQDLYLTQLGAAVINGVVGVSDGTAGHRSIRFVNLKVKGLKRMGIEWINHDHDGSTRIFDFQVLGGTFEDLTGVFGYAISVSGCHEGLRVIGPHMRNVQVGVESIFARGGVISGMTCEAIRGSAVSATNSFNGLRGRGLVMSGITAAGVTPGQKLLHLQYMDDAKLLGSNFGDGYLHLQGCRRVDVANVEVASSAPLALWLDDSHDCEVTDFRGRMTGATTYAVVRYDAGSTGNRLRGGRLSANPTGAFGGFVDQVGGSTGNFAHDFVYEPQAGGRFLQRGEALSSDLVQHALPVSSAGLPSQALWRDPADSHRIKQIP